MKILISNDQPTAMYYIRLAIAKALSFCGHEVIMWDINRKSAFDAFDEFEPDLFITQGYNLSRSLMKCIKNRPNLNLIIRVSDWSDFNGNLDKNRYPVLTVNQEEIDKVTQLYETNNTICHIHHHPDYIDLTHGNWLKSGINVISLMNCADIFTYSRGKKDTRFETDLCIVGGRWGYKAQNIDRFIIPLCNPQLDYKIKIFGNQSWGIPQYCGFIPDEQAANVLSSAKICLSVHEPHSTEFGYDIVTRPFNLLANGCFCISDYVQALYDIFPNSIVHCKTPEEYRNQIDYFLSNPEERISYIEKGKVDILNHTAFDRIGVAFEYLNITNNTLEKKEEAIKKIYG